MWTRLLLKTNAKSVLQHRYWKSFTVCLITTLLFNLFGGTSAIVAVIRTTGNRILYGIGGFGHPYYLGRWLYAGFSLLWSLILGIIAMFVAAVVITFVQNVLRVGRCRFMMENRYGDSPVETLFTAFHGPYLNVVKSMFSVSIRVILGTFLFVLPGLHAALKYSMVPFLLAENPYLSPARARELSAMMTDGEKWDILVLHISFLGWRIAAALLAGLITFGFLSSIGFWFLEPYIQATYAELYAALRAKVLAQGATDETELAGFMRY